MPGNDPVPSITHSTAIPLVTVMLGTIVGCASSGLEHSRVSWCAMPPDRTPRFARTASARVRRSGRMAAMPNVRDVEPLGHPPAKPALSPMDCLPWLTSQPPSSISKDDRGPRDRDFLQVALRLTGCTGQGGSRASRTPPGARQSRRRAADWRGRQRASHPSWPRLPGLLRAARKRPGRVALRRRQAQSGQRHRHGARTGQGGMR